MSKDQRLFEKYTVWSNDDSCHVIWAFVLDLDHDQFAIQAQWAWERSFRAANPWLKSYSLTQKQTVTRKTPSSKHRNCNYWVLEPAVDPHAIPALREYIRQCEAAGYKQLGLDLRSKIAEFKADLLIKGNEDKFLYIFEDWDIRQGTTVPGENERESIDAGVLSVIRMGRDGFEQYDPYDMWLLVDPLDQKENHGEEEGSGDSEGPEEDDPEGG
jgi:hypothetical protein